MTEDGPSLILHTLKNSDQMPNNYLLRVSNKDTDTMWATCSKLTVMSQEQYYYCSGIFIANCDHISHLALVFLLLELNRLLLDCSIKYMLQFLLGFSFPSYSALLAPQIVNALLLKQNILYYYQVSQYKVVVWVQSTFISIKIRSHS